MKLPSIHPNGTSPELLFETYKAAHVAVENAISAVQEVEFHSRDYYPQGPEAFEEAREMMRNQLRDLYRVSEELAAVAYHAYDFRK